MPATPQKSVRSVLALAAKLGLLAVRGNRFHRRYFADEATAEAWRPETATKHQRCSGAPTREAIAEFVGQHLKGVTTKQLAEQFDRCADWAGKIGKSEFDAGRMFRCMVPNQGWRYFTSAEQCDLVQAAVKAESAEKAKVRAAASLAKWSAWEKATRAERKANHPAKPRVAKPPKVAKPGAELIAKPYKQPAAPARGPARLDAPEDNSKAKTTIAPTPPGRFEVPADFRGAFSTVGVGRDVQTGRGW